MEADHCMKVDKVVAMQFSVLLHKYTSAKRLIFYVIIASFVMIINIVGIRMNKFHFICQ